MSAQIVNTHEAKSRLSELIRAVENGDEVIVARNGRPVARIVAWQAEPINRSPGSWAGRVSYFDDLVSPDPDVASLFDESTDLP